MFGTHIRRSDKSARFDGFIQPTALEAIGDVGHDQRRLGDDDDVVTGSETGATAQPMCSEVVAVQLIL